MYAIRSYYDLLAARGFSFASLGDRILKTETACVVAVAIVITSYSIHYTKLYDSGRPRRDTVRRADERQRGKDSQRPHCGHKSYNFV